MVVAHAAADADGALHRLVMDGLAGQGDIESTQFLLRGAGGAADGAGHMAEGAQVELLHIQLHIESPDDQGLVVGQGLPLVAQTELQHAVGEAETEGLLAGLQHIVFRRGGRRLAAIVVTGVAVLDLAAGIGCLQRCGDGIGVADRCGDRVARGPDAALGCCPGAGPAQLTQHEVGGGAQILLDLCFKDQAPVVCELVDHHDARTGHHDHADGNPDHQLDQADASLCGPVQHGNGFQHDGNPPMLLSGEQVDILPMPLTCTQSTPPRVPLTTTKKSVSEGSICGALNCSWPALRRLGQVPAGSKVTPRLSAICAVFSSGTGPPWQAVPAGREQSQEPESLW
eukprot:Opistho-1_new@53560